MCPRAAWHFLLRCPSDLRPLIGEEQGLTAWKMLPPCVEEKEEPTWRNKFWAVRHRELVNTGENFSFLWIRASRSWMDNEVLRGAGAGRIDTLPAKEWEMGQLWRLGISHKVGRGVAMVLGGTQERGYILTRGVRSTVQARFTEDELRRPDGATGRLPSTARSPSCLCPLFSGRGKGSG